MPSSVYFEEKSSLRENPEIRRALDLSDRDADFGEEKSPFFPS